MKIFKRGMVMKELSRMQWEPKYSVNVEEMDVQHRKLFDILNHLVDIFESGADDLLPVINDLVKYLSYHFHQELMVMKNADYPRFLIHSQEHQKFTEQVHEFLKSYKAGDKNLASEMLSFLSTWVREHTLKVDKQYGDYLLKNVAKPQPSRT
jgi:hemerythrin-like metal-binding protein